MTIEKILKTKGRYAAVVDPDAKIADVITQLEEEDVGALLVSSDGQHLLGIISERDVVRGLQVHGPSVLEHAVHELMTKEVVTCTAADHVAGVMALMTDQRIRHVPVLENGKLAGIVSIGDIVKLRLDEVQAEANIMRDYITEIR